MDMPVQTKSTISGPLPIRTAKKYQPEEPQSSKLPTEPVQIDDSSKASSKSTPDVTCNQMEDNNMSATSGQVMTGVGYKKHKHKRPKGKRGLVSLHGSDS